MEFEKAVGIIQYVWRLNRFRKVLDDAFSEEIDKKTIKCITTLQKHFKVKLRKRYINLLVHEAMLRIERAQDKNVMLSAGHSLI